MKLFILIFLVHSFASACLLDKINIIGLEKTNEQVVLKKINTEIGAEINSNSVELIRQNLKNMQIFSKVEINFDESICRLQVDLVEKWTTIPIFKIGSGGGTKYYVLGVYDVNFLGTYQELGAQYENFQGNNSFVLWYRNPQFIYNNLKLGFDVWNTMREKLIYSAEGVRQGGYSLERKKLNSFIDYEINSSIKIGAAIETNQDVTSDKDISDEVKNENTLNANNILKTETDYRLLSMNIKLGRLNYDNYLIEGAQLTLSHQLITNTKSSNAYSRNMLELLAYKKIFDTDNISLRLIAAQQNNNDLSQLLEIGGLTEVRGYFDGQFRDNKFNLLNLEYRKTVLEYNKYLLVQAVGFYDRAQVGASLKDLESMGLGLRFISPQIYRFNLRFDFALKTMSKEKQVLSFGLQQFF